MTWVGTANIHGLGRCAKRQVESAVVLPDYSHFQIGTNPSAKAAISRSSNLHLFGLYFVTYYHFIVIFCLNIEQFVSLFNNNEEKDKTASSQENKNHTLTSGNWD